VHGILPLDKPAGMTSNEALQYVRRLYDARKAGHTGSLDRTATGLLPICFGEGTKFSAYLLNADKHYRAVCRLGIETATGDAAGDVLDEKPVPLLERDRLEAVLEEFRGEIQQVPPMYSALKYQGQRLYKLAYQGKEIERSARPVTIRRLRLDRLEPPFMEIDVVCTKGTYIRTLAVDIGAMLGCGAHVAELRRLGAGPYTATEMVELATIEQLARGDRQALDNLLRPIDSALLELPGITLIENVAHYLRQGQPVTVPNAPTEGFLRLYGGGDQFMGLGEVLDDGRVGPRRLVKL